jgi:hypothetical protein
MIESLPCRIQLIVSNAGDLWQPIAQAIVIQGILWISKGKRIFKMKPILITLVCVCSFGGSCAAADLRFDNTPEARVMAPCGPPPVTLYRAPGRPPAITFYDPRHSDRCLPGFVWRLYPDNSGECWPLAN